MPETGDLLATVAVAAAVTWALRALPFAALAPLRHSALVGHLRRVMPLGVVTILVVYTLRHLDPTAPARAWPTAVALAVTVALHLWRRNALWSVLGGTLVHTVLASAFG